MNYPLIRRTIALALALVLALTLSVSLIAPARAEDEGKPTITGDGVSGGKLTLTPKGTAELTAEWKDAPKGVEYTWSCSEGQGFVSLSGTSGKSVTVTAKAEGQATITLTATWTEEAEEATSGQAEKVSDSAKLTVIVQAPTPVLSIGNKNTTVDRGETVTFTATLTNPPAGAKIEWSEGRTSDQYETKLPDRSNPTVVWSDGEDGTILTSTVTYTCSGAGEFIITATAVAGDKTIIGSDTKRVTVSGIFLSGDKLDLKKNILTMYVNGSAVLVATPFGDAGGSGDTMFWESADSMVVSVMPDSGSLNAWTVGETVVTVTWGKYTANCTVLVPEDTSVIADKNLDNKPFTASAGEPLNFLDSGLYKKLENMTEVKTSNLGAKSTLSYITNLKVSPDQGTLYYNYSTEADTGDGVSYTDRFAETAKGTVLSAGRLYFVPERDFSGTAEITFSAVSGSRNFAGTIRVEVDTGAGPGDGTYQLSYGARAGEAVWFQTDDFNAYCQSMNGRDFNYIVFNLPKSSEGMLYYNYVAGSGNPVTTTLQFTRTGRYTIDDVCFVPNAAFEGKVTINFRVVDTSGVAHNGSMTVSVTAVNPNDDSSSVLISSERGRPVTLQSNLFHDACQATLNDTLSFVTFTLPDPSLGTLYYNYRSDGTFDSRVTAAARYYFSGVPGLGSVSFVPASNATGRVAIPYTGYGSGGASYSGTLYITPEGTDRSTIYYSVAKGGTVAFSASDFYNAGQHTAGAAVSYVIFRTKSGGSLHYNNSNTGMALPTASTSTTYRYYRSPTGSQKSLSRVSFRAGDTVGAVTITYDAYNSSNQKLFTGKVVIQVGSRTPEDISLSCTTGGQAGLSAVTLNSVCSAVMSGNLSCIEITSVPAAEKGHLYFNYSGFGTGTVVEPGDRFYRVGSPGIGQLNFIPFARFTGEAEITYIGYGPDEKEQVSGRIVVNVTNAATSMYFNDMGSYAWAIDSVDYLRRNGTVNGIGGGYFGPGGTVKRGDFVLMLVRAYHLTANGSASFHDVPGDSYYADAIRIAALRGIISGSNGYFSPEDALTRQDAMLMLYKTLEVSGKTTTNGLVADLTGYYDAGEIDGYAREAVGSLVQMGVVKGNGGGYLLPKSRLARAEAAILLHTIMTL